MNSPVTMEELRERIIARPDVVLDDRDVMQALLAANDKAMGPNVVDLRGRAIERLEARLERVEAMHRSVIATAYENLAGMAQIHRAALRILEPDDFEGFLAVLDGDAADILGVDRVRLVLECRDGPETARAASPEDVVLLVAQGAVQTYLTRGRSVPVRSVLLRPVDPGFDGFLGPTDAILQSEACAKLDIGPGRLPALLVMAARDPTKFTPAHGTDLIAFYAEVVARALRRWLA